MRYTRTGLILQGHDYPALVDFYTRVLELPVMFALDDEHSVLTCLDMGGAYLMVEPGGPPPVARKDIDQNPVTLRFNVDDIDAAAEALTHKGVAFRRRDNPWGRTLDFTDPEGNACQIRGEAGFGA